MTLSNEIFGFLNDPNEPLILEDRAIRHFQKLNKAGTSNQEIEEAIFKMSDQSDGLDQSTLLSIYDGFLEHSQQIMEEKKESKKNKIFQKVKIIAGTVTLASVILETVSGSGVIHNFREINPILNHVGNADNMALLPNYILFAIAGSATIAQAGLIKKDFLRYQKASEMLSTIVESVAPAMLIAAFLLVAIDVETLQIIDLGKSTGSPDIKDIPAGLVGLIAGTSLMKYTITSYSKLVEKFKKKQFLKNSAKASDGDHK